MDKNIYDYSNPQQVRKMVDKYYSKTTPLYYSTRSDKKYMLLNPNTNKFVHFGTMKPPMEDFTKHMDERRRYLFRQRNHRWANADKWSSAYMSYYLLW
jgi:t-SNARE complex subunit (syntaxin)